MQSQGFYPRGSLITQAAYRVSGPDTRITNTDAGSYKIKRNANDDGTKVSGHYVHSSHTDFVIQQDAQGVYNLYFVEAGSSSRSGRRRRC